MESLWWTVDYSSSSLWVDDEKEVCTASGRDSEADI